MTDDQSHRLPRTVVPRHYRLRLEPDLEQAVFAGSAEVTVEVRERTERLLLNALELDIGQVRLHPSGGGDPIAAEVEYDEEAQRAAFLLAEPAQPGQWRLTCRFTGVLNDQLRGFYRSVFTDADGREQAIATTQFEATDARRAFPCWDEPDFKASFGVTLVIPEGLTAVSNEAEVGRRSLEEGRVEITFADTIPMSTYLAAFAVGPFAAAGPVDVDGVPLRVIAPQGKEGLAEYALRCGEFCLRYLTDYYGIPYPGGKLDLVAIPDFAFGAMENLGCVTFRETALLADEGSATTAELMRVLDVIGHELAHMWFGDLVTMEWWDGIWLNEAFATFMEMKATDAMRPDWNRWLEFAAAERPWALKVDDLAGSRPVEFEVRMPEEAHAMFDAITYGKGSAVLWMMEQFIGEDVFREGVGEYLRAHAYGNTRTAHLWEALNGAYARREGTSGPAGEYSVGEIMDDWILQAGLPRLEAAADGRRLSITVDRHLLIPDGEDRTRWKVPVQARGRAGGAPFAVKTLITGDSAELVLDGPVEWACLNAGGCGFYRVRYDRALAEALVDRLDELSPVERFTLADDAWALVESGHAGAVSFLELAGAFREEAEPAVWGAVLGGAGLAGHHLADGPAREPFERWADELLEPLAERLGWEPSAGETDNVRRLRGRVIGARGRLANHPPTVQRAREICELWAERPEETDPETAAACLMVTAAHGGPADYEIFLERHLQAADPQLEHKYLRALTAFDNPEAADRTYQLIREGTVRSQDATWVLGALFANFRSGAHAWERFAAAWPGMADSVPPMTHSRMLSGLTYLSQPGMAERVNDFFAEHPLPHAVASLAQNLERLSAMTAMRERETAAVTAYLTGGPS